ncbi:MAG TPA: UvrD-helicase domain-containing protein [Phycisphaerae bacterium]|nr:UvrD-helicase domain-containing protein [Phycisphaerae bacterium]
MDPLDGLNDPQKQAVTHVAGPLLVLAGAGSGKTRVITRRVAYLVQQGAAPWNVLAITFTNKAAEEMSARVREVGVPRGATVCTFHSLCARCLREFAAEAGLQTNYSIVDRDDQVRLVKQAMADLDLSADKLSPSAVHAAISRAKNDLSAADAFAEQAADFFSRRVAAVYRRYEQLLESNNSLDFDDLLVRMTHLMRDRPEVRRLLADRYQYILIDEYQDTNRAQYFIAHGIALEHENICATGDPDQSIYAWRGADIKNILEFESDYPHAKVIRLDENYRSTAPILHAASNLIAHNRMRKDKTLWTRRAGGSHVRVLVCDDEHAEARELARRVELGREAGRPCSDMAVFYRVNSLSRVVEDTFVAAGIPYRIARGIEFYNRKEIKDVLAYLKLMVNPADDLSCLRAVNTPHRGIGQTTVRRLGAMAAGAGASLLDACRRGDQAGLGASAVRKVAAFAEMIDSLAASQHATVKDTVEDVVHRSGLADALRGADSQDSRPWYNVEELISAAAEYDKAAGGTLAEYLQRVSLVSDADHFEGAGGAVTLMTLHAAKGLEFPVVFIIGCEQGLLPFERADESVGRVSADARLEEERRLAFVGMTRAKDELTLMHARQRMIRGRTTPQAPSPFLNQIGRTQVAVEDLTTAAPRRPTRRRERSAAGFYADVSERAAIEAAEDAAMNFPPEYEYLKAGSVVRHKLFGLGTVIALRQRWPQTRAEILFEDCGKKVIVLARAGVEILGGD